MADQEVQEYEEIMEQEAMMAHEEALSVEGQALAEVEAQIENETKDYKELRFSHNWNNKLDCLAFTTLRLSNRFNIDDIIRVYLKDEEVCRGKVIGKKYIMLKDINEYIARIDTGYSKEECKDILRKMYINKNINWETQIIHFYLIMKIKE